MAENALLKDGSTHNKKDPFIENGMAVQRSLASSVHVLYIQVTYIVY